MNDAWTWPPVVIVRDLAQAERAIAALRAVGRAVGRSAGRATGRADAAITLLSAPKVGELVGPTFFSTLVARLRADHPDLTIRAILDCGTAGGRAMAALRHGTIDAVVFTGGRDTLLRLADMADQVGLGLMPDAPKALDTARASDTDLAAWLQR